MYTYICKYVCIYKKNMRILIYINEVQTPFELPRLFPSPSLPLVPEAAPRLREVSSMMLDWMI